MYYNVNFFNQYNLFQNLGGWLESIASKVNGRNPKDIIEIINQKANIEWFLFRAYSGIYRLLSMEESARFCVQQFKMQKPSLSLNTERINFWSPVLVDMVIDFNPFLNSMRIMQDYFLKIIKKETSIFNVPRSFNAVMKNLNNYKFKEDIKREFNIYWKKSGSRIKQYRDLEQHYQGIIDHTFLQLNPEEKLVIYLPDNPQERSINKTSYYLKIDALSFFRKAYFDFNEFAVNIASIFGYKPKKLEQPFPIKYGEIIKGKERTILLTIEDPLKCTGIEIRQNKDGKIVTQFRDAVLLKVNRIANPEFLNIRKRVKNLEEIPSPVEIKIRGFKKTDNIEEYVLFRADGYCENCGKKSPHVDRNNKPYLELEYITPPHKGGLNSIYNIVALCQDCQLVLSLATNKEELRNKLKNHIKYVEEEIDKKTY